MNSATWHIAGQFVMHQILTTVNDMNGLYSKSILKTTATNMHHIVEMHQTSSFVHTGDHFTHAIQFATPRLFHNHLMSAVKYHTEMYICISKQFVHASYQFETPLTVVTLCIISLLQVQ